jgi:hypothetical protein
MSNIEAVSILFCMFETQADYDAHMREFGSNAAEHRRRFFKVHGRMEPRASVQMTQILILTHGVFFWGLQELPRRDIVKVVLSQQQREILDVICRKLGQSESETLRVAFMEYARSLSLVTEKVHAKLT